MGKRRGGEKNPRAVCCILVTHQGLETKTSPSAPSSAPPLILPNFLFSQEERETECFSRLTEGGRAAKPCTCSYLFPYFPVRVDALLSPDMSACNNSNTIMLLHRLSAGFSCLCHHEQPRRQAHHPVMKTQTSPAA